LSNLYADFDVNDKNVAAGAGSIIGEQDSYWISAVTAINKAQIALHGMSCHIRAKAKAD
jgi:hypothetical protein